MKPTQFIGELNGKNKADVSWLNIFLERYLKDLASADSFYYKMLRIFTIKVDGMSKVIYKYLLFKFLFFYFYFIFNFILFLFIFIFYFIFYFLFLGQITKIFRSFDNH